MILILSLLYWKCVQREFLVKILVVVESWIDASVRLSKTNKCKLPVWIDASSLIPFLCNHNNDNKLQVHTSCLKIQGILTIRFRFCDANLIDGGRDYVGGNLLGMSSVVWIVDAWGVWEGRLVKTWDESVFIDTTTKLVLNCSPQNCKTTSLYSRTVRPYYNDRIGNRVHISMKHSYMAATNNNIRW